ncbi:hypothetical protein SAMN03159512_04733 [Pseudomonas sp. NFR09]|uniref:hypothetical protein n=1 Tax=Pseudomonas sp. NFR09 TaxID=1566249 RepID=UPI0008ADC800|nr:hypothetical protein [Pseudomonas sp. NFR09]SEU04280.1 hypothetical protein SAMN03159512_04733 [Pseudomonas sp. NFR09]
MSDQPFSLDQLYTAVEQHLQEHLPGIQGVSFWPDLSTATSIPTPVVLLEIAEMEPAPDIGTGETSLTCKFEARIIVDSISTDPQRQAVQLASQLAVLLRGQSWGLAVDFAEFVRSTQDWTKPELDGYFVWLVEWDQTVYLGAEQWPWPDEPPGSLVIDLGPGVGPINPGELQ